MKRSAIVLLLLGAACFLVPAVAALFGADPNAIDATARSLGPSAGHWLGTDELGRDVLLRLLAGGRVSLSLALLATVFAVALGSLLGLAAGYYGGASDRLLMRTVEAILAIPRLPLMMLLLAIDPEKIGLDALGPSVSALLKLLVVIVLFSWPTAAQVARSESMRVRELDYVVAARGLGASDRRILFRHILPNIAGPLLALSTIEVAEIIVYESVLSYLGLGVQPPTPSWGAMLRNALSAVETQPMLLIGPGVVTALTVAAFHGLSEGLRAALDPRRQGG